MIMKLVGCWAIFLVSILGPSGSPVSAEDENLCGSVMTVSWDELELNQYLTEVNIVSGEVTEIGEVGEESWGLAVIPGTKNLYGLTQTNRRRPRLVEVNPEDGTSTKIGKIKVPRGHGLAIGRFGEAFTVSENNILYRLNLATAQTRIIGPITTEEKGQYDAEILNTNGTSEIVSTGNENPAEEADEAQSSSRSEQFVVDLAFDSKNTLHAITAEGILYTVNTMSGKGSRLGKVKNLPPDFGTFSAIMFDDEDSLYGFGAWTFGPVRAAPVYRILSSQDGWKAQLMTETSVHNPLSGVFLCQKMEEGEEVDNFVNALEKDPQKGPKKVPTKGPKKDTKKGPKKNNKGPKKDNNNKKKKKDKKDKNGKKKDPKKNKKEKKKDKKHPIKHPMKHPKKDKKEEKTKPKQDKDKKHEGKMQGNFIKQKRQGKQKS